MHFPYHFLLTSIYTFSIIFLKQEKERIADVSSIKQKLHTQEVSAHHVFAKHFLFLVFETLLCFLLCFMHWFSFLSVYFPTVAKRCKICFPKYTKCLLKYTESFLYSTKSFSKKCKKSFLKKCSKCFLKYTKSFFNNAPHVSWITSNNFWNAQNISWITSNVFLKCRKYFQILCTKYSSNTLNFPRKLHKIISEIHKIFPKIYNFFSEMHKIFL